MVKERTDGVGLSYKSVSGNLEEIPFGGTEERPLKVPLVTQYSAGFPSIRSYCLSRFLDYFKTVLVSHVALTPPSFGL